MALFFFTRCLNRSGRSRVSVQTRKRWRCLTLKSAVCACTWIVLPGTHVARSGVWLSFLDGR